MSLDQRAFYATIEAWRERPFEWTEANCGHFAAAIGRCWGIELEVPPFPETEDAIAWLRERKARSYYEYLRKRMGKPKPPLQAGRGWIAYCKGKGLSGAAIGTIDRKALFVGDRGLIQIPLSQVTCAFNPGNWRG